MILGYTMYNFLFIFIRFRFIKLIRLHLYVLNLVYTVSRTDAISLI